MKFEEAHKVLKGIPFISDANARELYDFIIEHKFANCLELGFAHGVASCYIAAAIDELGGGKLVSVDLIGQDWQIPSIEELLDKLGLQKYVEIHREVTGYNWYLHNEIARNTAANSICKPVYDFCIIDGPKNWTIDSSAFFLADKLLKPNGWVIFDDYEWTYGEADTRREATDGITHRKLSEAERITPQVKEIFNLLVMQHPSYANFKIHAEGDWAWAQKKQSDHKIVSFTYSETYKDVFSRVFNKLKRTLKGK